MKNPAARHLSGATQTTSPVRRARHFFTHNDLRAIDGLLPRLFSFSSFFVVRARFDALPDGWSARHHVAANRIGRLQQQGQRVTVPPLAVSICCVVRTCWTLLIAAFVALPRV